MIGALRKNSESLCSMKKSKWVNSYLKWATVFGAIGWITFFTSIGLYALKFPTIAYYTGGFSIFIGWFVSGYFWIRYGLSQGKSIKQIMRERIPWFKTKKH